MKKTKVLLAVSAASLLFLSACCPAKLSPADQAKLDKAIAAAAAAEQSAQQAVAAASKAEAAAAKCAANAAACEANAAKSAKAFEMAQQK